MLTLLGIVHVLIGFSLILFVLLQDPKGGAMGVFSGGSSSSSFFGASGASNFLSTTTKWLAGLFAISCLVLTYYTANRGGSVMDKLSQPLPMPSVPGAPSSGSATPDANGAAAGAVAAPAKATEGSTAPAGTPGQTPGAAPTPAESTPEPTTK